MEYVGGSFLLFYIVVLFLVTVQRARMSWGYLRNKYPCTRKEVKLADDPTDCSRFVYAINDNWTSTNLISTAVHDDHLYLWGSEILWGWIFFPVKIPFRDLEHCGKRLCYLSKRDVVEIHAENVSLKYAIKSGLEETSLSGK